MDLLEFRSEKGDYKRQSHIESSIPFPSSFELTKELWCYLQTQVSRMNFRQEAQECCFRTIQFNVQVVLTHLSTHDQ